MYGGLKINIGHWPNNINGFFNGFRRTGSKGTMRAKIGFVKTEREGGLKKVENFDSKIDRFVSSSSHFRSAGPVIGLSWNFRDKKIKPIDNVPKRDSLPLFAFPCWVFRGKYPNFFLNRTDGFFLGSASGYESQSSYTYRRIILFLSHFTSVVIHRKGRSAEESNA